MPHMMKTSLTQFTLQIYCPDEVKNKPYYHSVDLSKYISAIIDTLNHDTSVNDLIDATQRIQDIVQKHNNK